MARRKRQQSSLGIYHVVLRGINKQIIFEEASDYLSFIQILQEYKEILHFQLYAYCLMDNHVHLLMKAGDEEIGITMKRIGIKFVRWYNRKYSRTGHLFQGRFGSEPIEDQRYFLTVFRYIHQNPIRGGAEKILGSYPWSSWQDYAQEGDSWIDKEGIRAYFDTTESCVAFMSFISEEPGYEGFAYSSGRAKEVMTDEKSLEMMKEISGCDSHIEFLELDIKSRNAALKQLRRCGVGERQMSRVTGVSRGIIHKVTATT